MIAVAYTAYCAERFVQLVRYGGHLGGWLFLAPFVVHRLGNVAYGVWVLAISSVGYLNLLDLGMRSSVIRFVSKGNTTQDHEGASEALSYQWRRNTSS